MQKKAIAIAVASALAAPMAASAQPTIYGKLHFSLDYVTTDDKANAIARNDVTGETEVVEVDLDLDKNDFATGVSRSSRLGFKGSENLGGDLKALWQVETQLNTNVGSSGTVTLRNTFVGLAGSGWGSILFGKHDTPYKMSTGKIDFWADTIADYNNVIGTYSQPVVTTTTILGSTFTIEALALPTTSFDERLPQMVAYISPNWSGFSLAAAWGAHRSLFTGDEEPTKKDDNAYSIMGVYDQGPFYAALAWEQQSGLNIRNVTGADPFLDVNQDPILFNDGYGDNEVRAWKIGAAWRPQWGQIGAVYEDMSDKVDDSPMSRRAWYLNAMYKFGGNWAVKGAYGQADKSDWGKAIDVSDQGRYWALGLDYNLSKRTTAYLIYAQADNKDAGGYGLKGPNSDNLNDTSGSNFYTSGLGQSIASGSLGVIHKF